MSFFGNQSNWQLRSLKEIATLKRGYDLPTKLRTAGKVPIYAANGQNGSHNEAKIKGPGVITGRSGTIGKVHYTSTDYWPLNTTLSVTNFHGNDPKWVFYMLKAFQLERFVEGAGVPTLNRNLVHDELIPLAPLDEQKRIAAILDKADAIRRKRKQAIQLADDFLRSVFLDMFGDPVSNPKGWKKKPLKELTLKLGSGSTPRGGKEAYLEEGISLIRSLNVHDNKFVHKDLAFISDTQADKLKNVVIEKDDLLLNITGASVCRATLVDNDILPARVNQHVCIIREKKEKVLPTFLARLITSSSYKQKLMQIATAGGATREAITKQQVESLDIIVPPLDIQEKFMSIVGKVEKLLKISELQSQEPLFNSLSQKAFAGEL